MGETGGAKLLGELLGHAPGVAEEESGKQRPVDRHQVLRARQHQRARVVGGAVERRA